jgi:hopene-associated glycosyltransferase HpnB
MIALISLFTWLYLFLARGRFWRSAPELGPVEPLARALESPDVDILIPARDEAQTIGAVISSLLAQDYPGRFSITVIDDGSVDGTAAVAAAATHGVVPSGVQPSWEGPFVVDPPGVAQLTPAGTAAAHVPCLRVLAGEPKPPGWSGKLWALNQGVAATSAPILLFTDADIVHEPRHLSALMARLGQPRVEMVSEMVRLRCESIAERLLVPAFVYFFQLLYPFAKVNDPRSRIAAAAGGTILLRRGALQRIGGLHVIKDALIDDVALARHVKRSGAIFLGHSGLAASIRAYPDLAAIWRMIARTAFTQLRYSAPLLVVTLAGLAWVFLVPLAAVAFGHGWTAAAGAAAFALAALSYTPTLTRYGQSPFWSLALPVIAIFYLAATVGSALNHWRGTGVEWKRRAYDAGLGP